MGKSVFGIQSTEVNIFHVKVRASELKGVDCAVCEVSWKRLRYEGHLESKERFAIKKYLLIIGKKKNMQVLSHTFTYFST